jgi:hypothetical protein
MKIRSVIFPALLALFPLAAHGQTTWPRQMASSAGEVTLYQPQIDTYTGNQLTAHAAVSVARPAGKPPVFGALFFTATVSTDRGTGIVNVEDVAVTNSKFPNADASLTAAVTQAVTQDGSQGNLTLSQTQLLAQLALTQKEQAAAADLNNTPPQILFETQPSVLVSIDGEPKLTQAPNSSLMTVVNTPFFIALDPSTKTYYLRGGGQWLSTADILQGPWAATSSVPDAVTALAAKQPEQDATTTGVTPQIIVATQPTELIETTGPAEYGPIDNTNLLYVTNTDSDVFMDIDTQSVYVLLSGRWFSAATQAGPWTYVPPAQLPADFAKIPAGLPISSVLASVPNTQAAQSAVLDSQVPQTAAIQRNAPAPKVAYDGEPKFQPVAKSSSVSYAVNTPHSVVKVENTYYVCSDGVWYQGPAALGPWVVSVAVPDAIYTIPSTCPIYPVTYCKIYSVTPDIVYCGYLPGYTGSYVYGGTVVYGTGWPYNAWYGAAFIPRPVTWGFSASFNAGWGSWGFGIGGGWGAASFGCSWNSGWWGCSNAHWNNWNWNSNWNHSNTWNQNVNINRNVTNNITNNYNNTHINRSVNNIYRNHPNRLTANERQRLNDNENHLAHQQAHEQNEIDHDRQAGADAANAQRQRDQQQEHRDQAQRDLDKHALNTRPDGDGADHAHRDQGPGPVEHPHDNVFADHDGNVYRHDDGQGWQRREGDQWKQPARNDENFNRNRGDLNRQFGARARGGEPRGGGEARGGARGGGDRGGGGGRRR